MAELSWFEDYGDDDFQGYDMSLLNMDEAYLSVNVEPQNTYRIFTRHTECIQCPFVKIDEKDIQDATILVDGLRMILKKVPYYLYRVTTEHVNELKPSDKFLCQFGDDFGEFGIYHLNVSSDGCTIGTIKKPVSVAFPVLTAFLIYCALFLCVFGSIYLWKKLMTRIDKPEHKEKEKKKRVKALDTFRGISIVVMIFVNYGAGGFDVLEHAHWNGLHFADLVFPWFMWIMGACVPISLLGSFKKQISNSDIFLNVLKRSVKLFCLGIFLGGGSSLGCFRIFGVLQRFGVAYFVVTTICLFLMDREIKKSQHKIGKHISDLIKLWKGWIVILIILFVHCMILFFLAEDGCPKGYLGPGGLHEDSKYFNCTGGATGFVDRSILGGYMYKNPTSKEVYRSTQAFDPEGILGCLTSIVHVFIGVQAGMILLIYQEHKERLIRWLSWSILTGIIGGALCGFSKEDGVIPVNKNLWSLSFVLVTSCFAFFLLSVCYILIDVKSWWSGKPFLFAGMNAIIMYIGHEMTYGHLPMRWTVHCGKDHGTHLIALIENLWGAGFWVVVAYYMYKINYFFSV